MSRHGMVDPEIRSTDRSLFDRPAGFAFGLCARASFQL
jgi:hypothetical protein